jgi:hypothetical protein
MVSDTQPSAKQRQALEERRRATLASLMEIEDTTIRRLTRLTLPEIQAIRKEVSDVLPAGNLPAFVLSGLLQIKERRVSPDQVSRDISALLRGMSLIPQGLYGVFIAGPATVLYAYQKLLQLAGKDVASAFPEGTWQFYLQFGLRGDVARHASETVGFHQAFPSQPDPITTAAAWVCATLEFLYRYDDLLATHWTERVMLWLLIEELTESEGADRLTFATLVRDWNRQCPYHSPADGSDYIYHRQATFRHFLHEHLSALSPASQARFRESYETRLVAELPAYLDQMTLLSSLRPERYQEHKESIPPWQVNIAFIWQDHTYLLPACQQDGGGNPLCYPPYPEDAPPVSLGLLPNGDLCDATTHQPLLADRRGQIWYQESGRLLGNLRPPTSSVVYGWVAAILSKPASGPPPTLDLMLAESLRPLQQQLRSELSTATQAELAALRRAPIILNWDRHPYELPLAYIRRARRGIGDHALTVFLTDQSIVFDQSHIFFDGVWGLAIAEIMTDSAVHWYRRLASDQPVTPQAPVPVPLTLKSTPRVETVYRSHRQRNEVTAESAEVETRPVFRLRQWLRQRGVPLTINDLLLLYRCFHAAWYQPSAEVNQALEAFHSRATSEKARAAYQAIEDTLARLRGTNPTLLIPMDASNVSPRERVFPTTFRNPLMEIGERFSTARNYYQVYRANSDPDHWLAVDKARRELLAYLKAFGELLDTLKAVTMRGESFNTATIRLLAHLPGSMQHLLDQIPQHIGILNEIIKGSEVFSNVGRVAPGTSLTRFISARDDGQTKELIWGILTDDQEQMRISLRDFRPFVPQLLALGEEELADMLARDYLESYVQGLNCFVAELSDIVTSKEPAEN